MTKYKKFEPFEYKIDFEHCWIKFYCPSCHEGLSVNSQDGIVQCSCGEKYSVSAVLFHVNEDKNCE